MNQNNQNNPNQFRPQNPENQPYSQFPVDPNAQPVDPNLPPRGYVPPQQGYYPPNYQPGQQPQPGGKGPGKPVPPKGKKAAKPKKPGNGKWVWLGILIMLILIVLGAIFGYNTAVQARKNAYQEQSVRAAAQQYQLAMTDIQNENFENAKTRLEYVLSVNPNYPGATEKYTEVVVNLYPKETPTPFYTPTPAPTATPDTRGEEEMFASIQGNMNAQQWETALANMDALRDKNLAFRSSEVDGMYYIALRNYGIQLINSGYLESGIYRITLAEAFGPIDALANNQRTAARNYLAGAGFWEIDWEKALNYYSNAYATTPGMYDRASGFTAQQRYAEASFQYASRLAQGQSDQEICRAIDYYNQGFAIGGGESYAASATAVFLYCNPPTNTPEPLIPTEMIYTPTVPGMEPVAPPVTDPVVNPAALVTEPVVPVTDPAVPVVP